MSKLIVLSNRVSLPKPDKLVAGGLAVALQDALQKKGGIWLGWNGEIIENTASSMKANNAAQNDIQTSSQHPSIEYISNDQMSSFGCITDGNIEYLTCPLTQQQYDQYYSGFANSTLWPAMHERGDLIQYSSAEFNTYQEVNALFAQKLKQIAAEDDVIWVHDYHFFSVARYCRQLGMRNKIGFFLHIPFARTSILKHIPAITTLLQDLCQFDLVGLQTEHDQHQCMQAFTTLLQAQKIQKSLISYQQRITTVKSFPIGINPQHIQQVAKQHNQTDVFDLNALRQQRTIIGVDRIDYSKGLLERFNAFAAFLQQYPHYQTKVTELQVACPCRMDIDAYKNLYDQVNQSIERINQQFGQPNWLPIDCINDTVEHDALMALYQQTDICWITSLRDGMNLVAKEYIAAQDPDNPGVLILSKFAGAAEQMQAAIIVDPTNQEAMVAALKTALEMPKAERIQRYQQLMHGIEAFDINDWCKTFLSDLRQNQPLQRFKNPSRAVNNAYPLQ